MKDKLKQLGRLFITFAVVGVTTFGGGYAMLPALQREVVEKRRWATDEEVMDWYAIGQCTPGIIAVNTATFVGQKQAGVLGGIFATLGVVLILNAVVKLWKKSVVDWKTLLIFIAVFACSVFLSISPVIYVLAAAIAGIIVKELEARKS